MRWATVLLVPVLCSCGRRDPPALGEMVEFARRTDRVGDRFEVELPWTEKFLEEGEGTVKTATTTHGLRWSEEVLEVKSGRASRTRRAFPNVKGDPDVVEADLLERDGWLDFFGQFERLVPARARLRETWTAEGLTGPGALFTHDESTLRAARATCTLRRVALWEEGMAEIERVAEIDVVIRFGELARPSKLEGTMRFGLQSGMLLQFEFGAHEGGTAYTLTGKRTLHPAVPAEVDAK